MSDFTHTCVVQAPQSFTDQLNAKLAVTMLEVPDRNPTNIIDTTQKYIVQVSAELGAQIKKLLTGEWCVSIAVEGIGPAKEFKLSKVIPMDNCNPAPDTVEFELPGSAFVDGQEAGCGDVYYIVVTVVGRDPCEHKPIGLAGFCKLGPVMVF